MVVPVCYSTLNHYFVRKRTTVMSICKAVQGVILMWYPQLLKKIMSVYGFRGTLLIVAGMSLHTFPGMIAMKMDTAVPRKIRTASIFSFELFCFLKWIVYEIEFHYHFTDDVENGKRRENEDLLRSKDSNEDSLKTNLPGSTRTLEKIRWFLI